MNSSVEFKDPNATITKALLDDMWHKGAGQGLHCIAKYYGGEIAEYIDSFYAEYLDSFYPNNPQGPKE